MSDLVMANVIWEAEAVGLILRNFILVSLKPLNDELLDLFIDSINLHNEFESNELPKNPPIYAVPVFGIMQFFKFGECHPNNQYNLSLDDENFDMKLKNYISLGYMSSSIATLMHQYGQERMIRSPSFMEFYISITIILSVCLLILNNVRLRHVIHITQERDFVISVQIQVMILTQKKTKILKQLF